MRLALLCASLCACGDPVTPVTPATETDSVSSWSLQVEPTAQLEAANPVITFHLSASSDTELTPPSALALVEGIPSAVSLGKYEAGETTEALAERMIPSAIYEEPNHIRLRAKGLLALGQTYTLISQSGVLGTVTIQPALNPAYLTRVWPPADSAYRVLQALFCGPSTPDELGRVELFPPGTYGRLEAGLSSDGGLVDQCVRLIPEDNQREGLMPPLGIGDYALEPTPFENAQELEEVVGRECDSGQVQLGPGCFMLEGDRGIITGPDNITFWAISSDTGWHLATLNAGQRLVVPNLATLSEPVLGVTVFDLSGRSMTDSVGFVLPEPSPRIVISEVMANPFGAEPAEEWVELTNAGTAPATMTGYWLADGGGQVELPAMILEPGAYVVLAREDFVGGQSGDVAPDLVTTVVRLPQVAKNGLSNSGEALRLIDATGNVVSTFPAVAAEREGTSIARRDLTVLDDDATGFLSHASPGASPGWANQTE